MILSRVKSPVCHEIIFRLVLTEPEQLDSAEFLNDWEAYDQLFGQANQFRQLKRLTFTFSSVVDKEEAMNKVRRMLPRCERRGILRRFEHH